MHRGQQHTIEIDRTTQASAPPRPTWTRVAARGRKMNGPCRAPSRQTSSFVGSPQPATAAGRPVPQRPAATHLVCRNPARHSPVGVGAGLGLLGVALLFGRADQARHHSFPHAHGTNLSVRPACRTSATMPQRSVTHTQIGEA